MRRTKPTLKELQDRPADAGMLTRDKIARSVKAGNSMLFDSDFFDNELYCECRRCGCQCYRKRIYCPMCGLFITT